MLSSMTDDESEAPPSKHVNPWANTRTVTVVLIALAAATIVAALLR